MAGRVHRRGGPRRRGWRRRSRSRCGRRRRRGSPPRGRGPRRGARARPRGRRRGASRPATNSTTRPRRSASVAPQRREVAGLEREHAVARRERVHERGLPRARARRRVDDDRPRGAEDARQALEQVGGERGELRAAVVDRRGRQRAQHAVGDVRRAGDLQEVATAVSATSGAAVSQSFQLGSHCARDEGYTTRTSGRASLSWHCSSLCSAPPRSRVRQRAGVRPAGGAHARARRGPRPARPDDVRHVREPDRLRRHVREALRRRPKLQIVPQLATGAADRSRRTARRSRSRCARASGSTTARRSTRRPSRRRSTTTSPTRSRAARATSRRSQSVEVVDPTRSAAPARRRPRRSPSLLADRAGMILSPKQLKKLGGQVRDEPGLRRGVQVHRPRRRRPHHARQVAVLLRRATRSTSSGSSSRSSPTARVRASNLRSGDVDVAERLEPFDVVSIKGDSSINAAGDDLARLPGHHDQHRQHERHREAVPAGQGRDAARPAPRAARGVRGRARPRRHQQGRLLQPGHARLRPDLARQPVVRQGPDVPRAQPRQGASSSWRRAASRRRSR